MDSRMGGLLTGPGLGVERTRTLEGSMRYLLLFPLLLPTTSNASLLYFVNQDNQTLSTYDVDAHTRDSIGRIWQVEPGRFDRGDLGWDVTTGTMFMAPGGSNTGLYTIDLTTGAAAYLFDHGLEDVSAVVFDGMGNMFLGQTWPERALWAVDKQTGASTRLTVYDTEMGGGFYFRGQIMYIENYRGRLFVVDPATGDVWFRQLTQVQNEFASLTFDADSNLAYSVDEGGEIHAFDATRDFRETVILNGGPSMYGSEMIPDGVTASQLRAWREDNSCGYRQTLSVSGATPNGSLSVYLGRPGTTFTGARCGIVNLPLAFGAAELQPIRADARGNYRVSVQLTPNFCGRYLVFVDQTTCEVSSMLAS